MGVGETEPPIGQIDRTDRQCKKSLFHARYLIRPRQPCQTADRQASSKRPITLILPYGVIYITDVRR